jgi:DNA-binding NtrC family response regulator
MAGKSKPSLLIVDDDPIIGESLQFVLGAEFDVVVRTTRAAAVASLRAGEFRPQLALIDLGLPPVPALPNEGFKLIADLLAHVPDIRILVLTGQNDDSNARRARALGAVDLVPKPCEPEYLKSLLYRALNMVAADRSDADLDRMLVGESPAIRKLRGQIDTYAVSTFPALIEGESGSGKERVAIALHYLSPRAKLPFLALNCAAISSTLLEPTLFGYAKGSFTGAASAKAGYFEDAGEGTLFLDEIGELPLDLQPKLLRVLENGEYQRVGETTTRHSRARIVAATNRDLKTEVKAGRFRADLYHRLSVFSLAVPPLREMGDDKLSLLEHYRLQYATKQGTQPFTLSAGARQAWLNYAFPGNVRELKNIVIRLTAKYGGYTLDSAEIEDEFDLPAASGAVPAAIGEGQRVREQLLKNKHFSLDSALKDFELAYIDAALDLSQGNISKAAKMLGMSRSTLYSRLETAGKLPDKSDKLQE